LIAVVGPTSPTATVERLVIGQFLVRRRDDYLLLRFDIGWLGLCRSPAEAAPDILAVGRRRDDDIFFGARDLRHFRLSTRNLVLAPSLTDALGDAVPDVVLAQLRAQAVVSKDGPYRPAHMDEVEVDIALVQLLVQGREHIGACRVQLVSRLEVENQCLDAFRGIDILQNGILYLGGVHPEQCDIDAEHQDSMDQGSFRMLSDATPGRLLTRDLAKNLDVNPARPVHQSEQ